MHGRQRCDEILRLIDEALAAFEAPVGNPSTAVPSVPTASRRA